MNELDIKYVDLSPFLMELGQKIGMTRANEEDKKRRNFATDEERKNDTFGAQAEIAVALGCNAPYNPTINTYRSVGDVGKIEVRFTYGNDIGLSCFVKKNDPDDTFIVSVGGVPPHFAIFGFHHVAAMRDIQTKFKFNMPGGLGDKVEIAFPIKKLLPIAGLNPALLYADANKDVEMKKLEEKFEALRNLLK